MSKKNRVKHNNQRKTTIIYDHGGERPTTIYGADEEFARILVEADAHSSNPIEAIAEAMLQHSIQKGSPLQADKNELMDILLMAKGDEEATKRCWEKRKQTDSEETED